MNSEEIMELTLGTQQCAQVAAYMYEQWQEAMKPPLYSYKSFPEWLDGLLSQKEKTNE